MGRLQHDLCNRFGDLFGRAPGDLHAKLHGFFAEFCKIAFVLGQEGSRSLIQGIGQRIAGFACVEVCNSLKCSTSSARLRVTFRKGAVYILFSRPE